MSIQTAPPMILINSSPQNVLKIFQPFLPIFVPIGVGFLAAACRREGFAVEIIDEQIHGDAYPLAVEAATARQGRVVFGFSVLTAALQSALDLARRLKERFPESLVVFGGIHSSAAPEEVLAHPQVDMVLRGEGEKSVVELLRLVEAGQDVRHLPGLSYREDGAVRHNPPATEAIDLASLPPFPYDLFEDPAYDLGFVISSRGCPYNCVFCSNRVTTGKRYRYLPPEPVVDTLEMLHEKYGRTFVLFLDDNFLVSKERIRRLISLVKARGLHRKMTFSFQARGDNVDRAILEDLFDAGFKSVFFGIETASERLMRAVKKGETVTLCADAARLAKDIGFHVSATFIFALPGETHEERLAAVRLARELQLDQVRFNNATPYPGTELYRIARDEGRLHVQGVYQNFNSVGVFVESPFDPIPFSYLPTGASEQEIRNDILFAYLVAYLDLARLREILFKPRQGVGWFNAGANLKEFLAKIPALAFLFTMMGIKCGRMVWDILRGRGTQLTRGDLLHLLRGDWHTQWMRDRPAILPEDAAAGQQRKSPSPCDE